MKILCRKCKEREVPGSRIKKHNYVCNQCDHKRYPRMRTKLRNTIIDHYGRECVFCGATENLQLDHTNGDGKGHSLSGKQEVWFKSLVEEQFPATCQVLCRQCNIAKQQMTNAEFKAWIQMLAMRFETILA